MIYNSPVLPSLAVHSAQGDALLRQSGYPSSPVPPRSELFYARHSDVLCAALGNSPVPHRSSQYFHSWFDNESYFGLMPSHNRPAFLTIDDWSCFHSSTLTQVRRPRGLAAEDSSPLFGVGRKGGVHP